MGKPTAGVRHTKVSPEVLRGWWWWWGSLWALQLFLTFTLIPEAPALFLCSPLTSALRDANAPKSSCSWSQVYLPYLPFQSLLQLKLWNKYRVSNIPSLIFIDASTGKVVCRNGLLVIRDDPEGKRVPCATETWTHSCLFISVHSAWPGGEGTKSYCHT